MSEKVRASHLSCKIQHTALQSSGEVHFFQVGKMWIGKEEYKKHPGGNLDEMMKAKRQDLINTQVLDKISCWLQ